MKKASSLWYINEVVDKLRDKEDSDYYIQYMMEVYPDLSLNVSEILCEGINNNTEKLLHSINKTLDR